MIALRARRVLAGGEERHCWWVTIDRGEIIEIGPNPPASALACELGDVDLIPGLVDLHSDCLEQKAHPRPTTDLPLEAALLDLDAELVAHGITSHFLCVCLEDDAVKYRSMDRGREIVHHVARLRPTLRADHFVHLRVDVTGSSHTVARELSDSGMVGLLSYMDHTPGQGQYSDEADWRKYYTSVVGLGDDELDARLAMKRAGQSQADEARAEVARIARWLGASLASHDDDSPAAVRRAVRLGASISEFPVNLEAALTAQAAGLDVVMGAPNARRGRSHLANLSAREALEAGCLDALASDYHPPSLLAAAYLLADDKSCSWGEALSLVTANPARAAMLNDRGRIEPGLRADLVAVARRGDCPVVVQTWVGGQAMLGVQLSARAA